MAEDSFDIVTQQAVMVAFCIPGVGPVLAAGMSIAAALHDKYGTSEEPGSYSNAQAIADLGTKIGNMLEGVEHDELLIQVRGWQEKILSINYETEGWLHDDSNDVRSIVVSRIGQFEEFMGFDTAKGFFAKPGDDPLSETRVKNLGNFFQMRNAYHAIMQAKLQWITKVFDLKKVMWCQITGDLTMTLHHNFIQSHHDASTYAEETVAMLEKAYDDLDKYTEDKIKGLKDPLARNKLLTTKLRELNRTSHLAFADRSQVKKYRDLLNIYGKSVNGLEKQPTFSHWDTDGGVEQAAAGNPVFRVIKSKLGARPRNSVRVVYETAADSSWVGVLENSPLEKSTTHAKLTGPLATQNAGSSDASLYYQTGGAGLNLAFDQALIAAGERGNVNSSLKTQYNAKYSDAWAADCKAARQDRLTSFLVPLDPQSHKGGSSVYCMVYSVGPKLTNGITDENAYQKVFGDAFVALAAHNKQFEPVINFRVALISTEIYRGNSDPAELRSQAARLVLQAARDAAASDASLANLTLLVNSNESTGGNERVAFDSAAKAQGLNTTDEGFYVVFVPSGN